MVAGPVPPPSPRAVSGANSAFPRLVFGAGPADPDGGGRGLRHGPGATPVPAPAGGNAGLGGWASRGPGRAFPRLGCRLGLWVLAPGGLAAYPAGFGLGLAVQRAFIILPMRCSALALAWM